jgi:hypothetical protein
MVYPYKVILGCTGSLEPLRDRTWTMNKFLEIGEIIIIIYCEAFINFCIPFRKKKFDK